MWPLYTFKLILSSLNTHMFLNGLNCRVFRYAPSLGLAGIGRGHSILMYFAHFGTIVGTYNLWTNVMRTRYILLALIACGASALSTAQSYNPGNSAQDSILSRMSRSLPTQPDAKATATAKAASQSAASESRMAVSAANGSSAQTEASRREQALLSAPKQVEVATPLKMPDPIVYTDYRDSAASGTPGHEDKTTYGSLFK